MELIRVPRAPAQLLLDLFERPGVDQVAQLLLPEQLLQQVAVERENLGPPLRARRVVLVHVVGHVVEEERGRVRRRAGGLDVDEVELAGLQSLQQPLQRRQVEDVLQALPVGLEDDRERAVLAGDLEEALRLEPLLPERRPLARPAAWDQERATGVLAKARAEERGAAELGHDELLDLRRVDDQFLRRWRSVRIRQVDGDPVVRPERLHFEAQRVPQPGADRHRPRRVHPGAERREDAHPPVADLVAEALDDDGSVGRNGAGRLLLVAQERDQVPRGLLVERMLLGQPLECLLLGERGQLARRLADRLAELVRPPGTLALPERDQARNARRRRDEHPVARDLLDPPARGAEQERLARRAPRRPSPRRARRPVRLRRRGGRRTGRGRGSCPRS